MKNKIIIILVSFVVVLGLFWMIFHKSQITTNEPSQKVVANPVLGEVTQEIDDDLIGRYVSISDSFEYFEIRSDGRVRLQMNYGEGYISYGYDNILATFLYAENTRKDIYMSFTLTGGEKVLVNHGLSINLIRIEGTPSDSFSTTLRGEMVTFTKLDK